MSNTKKKPYSHGHGEDKWAIGWHSHDPEDSFTGRLNALRAAVLGANDGIVSTAGLVMGVAGATPDRAPIVVAGIAGLFAGAISMAAGEYVSVSTQRDSERAMLDLEKRELEINPGPELQELAVLLEHKGLAPETALKAAQEMTEHDALAAHADIELGLDPNDLTNPWHAAWASMIAFTLGAMLPLLVIAFAPLQVMVAATAASVIVALGATGFASAFLGRAPRVPAVVRNIAGGAIAMSATYAIGMLVGTQLG